MSRSDATRPLGREDLLTREVDGEFFLYDPVTDRVVLINDSAAVIFALCDGTRTEDEIAAEVQRLYASEAEHLHDEVRATLAHFMADGLIASPPAQTTAQAAPEPDD